MLLVSLSGAAFAQQYPSGPITIVVPFTPGGTTDILGRLAGEVLQNEFKQSVVVENRTGGGGIIGNASVARAAPDGQTLLLAPTAFSIVPFTTKNLPYDPARDFKTITLMGYTANVMVVSPTLPVNSVKEFIDYAKSGDKYVTYASPGLGTPTQLGAEVFAHDTGIKMQHVPYRGAMPAVTGLTVRRSHHDVHRSRAGDAADRERQAQGARHADDGAASAACRMLPTVAETVPGFYLMGWQGLFAPGRTPDAIVDKINAPLVKYLKTPEAADRLNRIGVDVKWTTPAEMRDWVDSQLKHWGNIAKSAGIVPQ